MSEVTQNPSVILSLQQVDIPAMVGEIPGSPDTAPTDIFAGGMLTPPVNPQRAMNAARSSGGVMAVSHAVAQGTTGIGFKIVPRRGDIDVKDKDKWPTGAAEQHDRMEMFLQTGYRGSGQYSIRGAFHHMEHDRFILGWAGIVVVRSAIPTTPGLPPQPIALARLEACNSKFTRADREPTIIPVPVSLSDGRTLWAEIPRHFRRIGFRSSNGRHTWFKEYGDWRSMDSRTGRYSTGNRATPSTKAGEPGKYVPGKLPPNAAPAVEVAHFATSFPGAAPYGISGWHAELDAVDSAAEHVRLLVSYLKSGLHSVILAAANRTFDAGAADAAIQKIDELGRGRNGLGALITLSLMPQDSAGGNPMLSKDGPDDRGRIVLHELNTKLPDALLDDTLSDALAGRIAHSERIPGLLIGRSDNYNFATAAAAWATANRLRFMPHHQEHEAFLDALTAEMGITHWKFDTIAPEWEEKEPLAGTASVTGQLGGVSVNRAMGLLADVTGTEPERIKEWWGDIPMALVTLVLGADDPQGTLDALMLPGKPKIPLKKVEQTVAQPVVEALKSLEQKFEKFTA
jgi:capsid portal protein